MAVEQHFDFAIEDADAERLRTVGDFYLYILSRLGVGPESPEAEKVWHQFQAICVEELGVKPSQVTPRARFVEDLGVD